MTVSQRVVLSLAVLVLGVYSAIWWDDHRRIGAEYKEELHAVALRLGADFRRKPSKRSDLVGGLVAIVLLTVVALLAIWIPIEV